MKKWYNKIIVVSLLVFMLLTGGCFKDSSVGEVGSGCDKKKVYEYKDFLITEDNELHDLSEQGLQKEYVIIPNFVNGVKPKMYSRTGCGHWVEYSTFTYSEKVKKFYQADAVQKIEYYYYISQPQNGDIDNAGWAYAYAFSSYTNKVEQMAMEMSTPYTRFIYKKPKHKFFANDIRGYGTNNLAYKNSYINTVLNQTEPIFAYLLLSDYNKGSITLTSKDKIANVQFLYNYDNSPNQGYYWIDDLETGETLTFIPPNPTRYGYVFDGWYTDSECTNPCDFTVPYVKKEMVFKSGEINGQESFVFVYPQDYVTYCYAKWIKA